MNEAIHRDNLTTINERMPDWPQLLSRTVDDLSRVARNEMELLNTRLKILLETQSEKIAGMIILIVALSYGSFFVLGGVVLLIHLWLAWWLSFLITGTLIVIAGLSFQLTLSKKARKKEVEA